MNEFLKYARNLTMKRIIYSIVDDLFLNSELIKPKGIEDIKVEKKEPIVRNKVSPCLVKKEGGYPCPYCDKKLSNKKGVQQHIKSIHKNTKMFSCDQCFHQTRQPGNLRRHIEIMHEDIKFQCDKCLYQVNRKDRLKEHIENTHSGLGSLFTKLAKVYSCKYCDKQLSTKMGILRHTQAIHDEIKYSCDKCLHQTTSVGNLKRHIQRKHELVKFQCSQCEYKAYRKDYLKKHKHNKH